MKLRKSQRIMSLFLSLLMLLSTFAGSGFTVRAADPTEVATEDVEATAVTPTEVESDDIDPDASYQDIIIDFTTGANVEVLDKTKLDEGVGNGWTNNSTIVGPGALNTQIKIDSEITTGYSFVVAPNTTGGYKLVNEFIDTATDKSYYYSYNDLKYETGWKKSDGTAAAAADYTKEITGGYTVTDYDYVTGYKVVTLSATLLQSVLNGYNTSDNKYAAVVDATINKDSDGNTTGKNERPILYLNLKAAEKGKYIVDMPTVKDNKAQLSNLEDEDRDFEFGGTDHMVLTLKPGSSYNLAESKITIDVKKDNENAKIGSVQFPVTISKADTGVFKAGATNSDTNASAPIAFNLTNGYLYIHNTFTDAAYTDNLAGGNMKITITVDVTPSEVETYAVSVINDITGAAYDASLATNTFTVKGKDASTDLVANVKKGGNALEITVAGTKDAAGNGRAISRLYYTLGTSTTEADVIGSASSKAIDAAPGKKTVANNLITAPITLHVETTEAIQVDGVNTGFKLYDEEGTAISNTYRVVSGGTLKFKIGAGSGTRKPVDKVSVNIGGSKVTDDLKAGTDGYYTITGINDVLEIGVTAKTLGSTVDVTKDSGSTMTIKDAATPVKVIGSTTPANAASDGKDAAVVGEPYFFTIQPTATKLITKVEYTVGSSQTKKAATYVSGAKYNATSATNTSLWRIDGVTDAIKIYATEVDAVKIISDGLSKAVITGETLDGTKTIDTTGVVVPKASVFYYTVAGNAAKNIKATGAAAYQDGGTAPAVNAYTAITTDSKEFMIDTTTLGNAFTADKGHSDRHFLRGDHRS